MHNSNRKWYLLTSCQEISKVHIWGLWLLRPDCYVCWQSWEMCVLWSHTHWCSIIYMLEPTTSVQPHEWALLKQAECGPEDPLTSLIKVKWSLVFSICSRSSVQDQDHEHPSASLRQEGDANTDCTVNPNIRFLLFRGGYTLVAQSTAVGVQQHRCEVGTQFYFAAILGEFEWKMEKSYNQVRTCFSETNSMIMKRKRRETASRGECRV